MRSPLRQRGCDLFSLSRSGILYDVTNSHFEGFCASNPKAKHGKNKQDRNDCRQIAGGITFYEYGFPLAHETFEGNMADTKTLPLILDSLTHHEDGLKPVAILDGGFSSRANLTLLKERGYSYIVNTTRGSRRLVSTRLPFAVHTSSTFTNPANPTTNKKAFTKCSPSTGEPKSQPEEIVVPLERPTRFYAGSRSAMRNSG